MVKEAIMKGQIFGSLEGEKEELRKADGLADKEVKGGAKKE